MLHGLFRDEQVSPKCMYNIVLYRHKLKTKETSHARTRKSAWRNTQGYGSLRLYTKSCLKTVLSWNVHWKMRLHIRPLEVKKWVTWCATLAACTHWTSLYKSSLWKLLHVLQRRICRLDQWPESVLRVLAWPMSDDCCGFGVVQVSDAFTGRHACNTTRPHHICYAETGTRLFDEKYAPFERTSSRHWLSPCLVPKCFPKKCYSIYHIKSCDTCIEH